MRCVSFDMVPTGLRSAVQTCHRGDRGASIIFQLASRARRASRIPSVIEVGFATITHRRDKTADRDKE